MSEQELEALIKDLAALPKECEWVEFKLNNSNPQEIGEYISALSNSACYHKQAFGYLVYGIEDVTHKLRACYLHACLKYVSGGHMTNQSLRERFGIEEQNYPMVSRIIAETITAGLVKDYDPENRSKKYAKYVPFWT